MVPVLIVLVLLIEYRSGLVGVRRGPRIVFAASLLDIRITQRIELSEFRGLLHVLMEAWAIMDTARDTNDVVLAVGSAIRKDLIYFLFSTLHFKLDAHEQFRVYVATGRRLRGRAARFHRVCM